MSAFTDAVNNPSQNGVSGTTNSSSSQFGGLKSMSGISSFKGFGQKTDLNSPDVLLEMARQQGGAVAQAAEDLVHPQKSILSTIGDGFKNAFSEFVDIISVPQQIVAGIISPDVTIGEAIKKNISPSDVIMGDKDPNSSTIQKVGGFLTRTAIDVLLDPLTYLTFGAYRGIFGLSSLEKVTLGTQAAEQVGKEVLSKAAVSEGGEGLLKILRSVEKQTAGTLTLESKYGTTLGKVGEQSVTDLAKGELSTLLKNTIDAPLNPQYAKKAFTNLLEKYPQLTETLLDKGGIKFFGKSILSGQKISSVIGLIPGINMIDKITEPIVKPIQALFDSSLVKEQGKYIRLPGEFLDDISYTKDLIKATGDKRLEELSNIIKTNKLNVNEASILRAAVEAGKIPADERLTNAFKQLTGFNEEELKMLQTSGVNVTRLENHVPHVLVENQVNNIPFVLPPKQKVGAAIERTMKGTIEDLKAKGFDGFDENIVTALAQRTLSNTNVSISRHMLRDTAQKFGALASEAPKGYRAIDLSTIKGETEKMLQILGKEGDTMVFHPAIAKKLENFLGSVINDEPTRDLLKKFDSIQNLWKASVTSIFPAFHGRNAISNVFQHFLDLGIHSINPANHAMAGQLVYYDRKINSLQLEAMGIGEKALQAQNELHDLMTKNIFTDATGYKWSVGELRQEIKNRNVAFSRNVVGAIDIEEGQRGVEKALFAESMTPTEKAKALGQKVLPINQEFLPFKISRTFGTAVEEQARLVDFMANLNATGDVSHAAQRTKQFLFDYGNLTNFEKTFMKRVLPFYTFTRKNLELQARTLATMPGRISAEITGLNNLGDLMGGKLTLEEEQNLPDWMKSGIKILAKRKGSTLELFNSLGTPIEQVFSGLQPNQILGSISPLVRVPLEQATGYSFFQGKALSDVTNAAAFQSAPKVIRDFIGYTEIKGTKNGKPFTWSVSLRPERMNLVLNLPPTSRVFSSLKQMQAVDVDSSHKILQQLIGVRPYSIDVEQEAAKREVELRKQLESVLNQAGVLAKFTRTYIPKTK